MSLEEHASSLSQTAQLSDFLAKVNSLDIILCSIVWVHHAVQQVKAAKPCPKRLLSKEIQTLHSLNEHDVPYTNVKCFLFNPSSSCRAPNSAVHPSTQQKSKLQILQLCLLEYISSVRLLLMRSSSSLSLAKL